MIPALLAAIALSAPLQPPPLALESATLNGVAVRILHVRLSDPRVKVTVLTSAGFPDASEPFPSIIARGRPAAAVNGAYFSPPDGPPIGDIVIGGRVAFIGRMGTALAITPDNHAIIRRVPWGRTQDWSAYDTVLECGPALVLNGRVDVHPDLERFGDSHIMGRAARMGVGILPDGNLVIVNARTGVTFQQWAELMRALGCTDAMNLDAGASLAMYYGGRTIIPANRPLTNVLAIYTDGRTHAQAAAAAPAQPRALPGAAVPHSAPPARGAVVRVRICADTGLRANMYCPVTVMREFRRGARLPGWCRLHGEGKRP